MHQALGRCEREGARPAPFAASAAPMRGRELYIKKTEVAGVAFVFEHKDVQRIIARQLLPAMLAEKRDTLRMQISRGGLYDHGFFDVDPVAGVIVPHEFQRHFVGRLRQPIPCLRLGDFTFGDAYLLVVHNGITKRSRELQHQFPHDIIMVAPETRRVKD